MPLHGVLLVDKPRGMTSFDVIRRIRRTNKNLKIGHAGTLDPDASGLLVLCFGKATKLAGNFTASDKVYDVDFTLGVRTDTYDSTGKILEERVSNVSRDAFDQACSSFVGTIQQTVPMFSAVKIDGRKLYEYARKNIAITPPTKEVRIFSIEVVEFFNPHGKLRVHCSKGTYVRSLIHDIGERLGVGGVTTHIRRVQSGVFHVSQATELSALLLEENVETTLERKLLDCVRLQPIENK